METPELFSTSGNTFNDNTMFTDFDSYVYDTNMPETSKAAWDWNDFSGAMDTTMDSSAIDKALLHNITLGGTGLIPMENEIMESSGTLSFSPDAIFNSADDFSLGVSTPQLIHPDSSSSDHARSSSESDGPATPETTPQNPILSPINNSKSNKKRASSSTTTNPSGKKRGRRAIKRSTTEKETYEKEKRANNAVAAAKSRVKKADQQKDLLAKSHALGARNAELIQTLENLKMELALTVQEVKTHHTTTCAEGLLDSLATQCQHIIQTDHVGLMRDDIVNNILSRNEEAFNGYDVSEGSPSVCQ